MLKRAFKLRLAQWLRHRLPPASEHHLNHHYLFIFPTAFGWLCVLLSLLLFILGSNYQNNLILLLCYFLVSILLLGILHTYLVLYQTHITFLPIESVYANQHPVIKMLLKRGSPHGSLSLTVGQDTHRHLAIGTDNLVKIPLPPSTRGRHPTPAILLFSEYPFGLFKVWTHLHSTQTLLVYPEPVSGSVTETIVDGQSTQGTSIIHEDGTDDFNQLRKYRPGEAASHIAWKRFAQGRGLFSKQFEHQQIGHISLFLNKQIQLEQQLSRLCHRVLELHQQQQPYELKLGPLAVATGSGSTHLQQCLTLLAEYKDD